MNRDEHGIIGQIQADGSIEGGDAACWMGHWTYLTKEKFPYTRVFSAGFGAYVRHPVPARTIKGFGAHYSNPWDGVISRDQLTGVLAGIIAEKKWLEGLKLIIHHMAWLMLFSYNTRKNGQAPGETPWKWPDITGPDIWAMELRACPPLGILLYPLLCVFDLHTLLNTLLHRYQKKTDPINYAMKLITGWNHLPTPISVVAYMICNKKKLILELTEYWCGWRDGCDIVSFYVGELRD
jgi:hypothetical protein